MHRRTIAWIGSAPYPDHSPAFVQDCRGIAPRYDAAATAQLREVLYAARHVLTEATGGLPDSRTGQDLLPMLLQGKAAHQRIVDFSRFHTAALWLGPTLAAVGAFLGQSPLSS